MVYRLPAAFGRYIQPARPLREDCGGGRWLSGPSAPGCVLPAFPSRKMSAEGGGGAGRVCQGCKWMARCSRDSLCFPARPRARCIFARTAQAFSITLQMAAVSKQMPNPDLTWTLHPKTSLPSRQVRAFFLLRNLTKQHLQFRPPLSSHRWWWLS